MTESNRTDVRTSASRREFAQGFDGGRGRRLAGRHLGAGRMAHPRASC